MKTCTKCSSTKEASEFYGRAVACKECIKAAVKANRAAHIFTTQLLRQGARA